MRTPFRGSLVLLAVVGAFGCGEDGQPPAPEPKHPLTQVVHRLQDRFSAEDVDGVCALMAKAAHVQAGDMAHGTPTTCPRDVRKAFRMIDGGGGWLDGDEPRVAALWARGRNASVTLASDGWAAKVPFVKEATGWKLAGFFGLPPKQFKRVEKAAPAEPFPPPQPGSAVTVADADGNPCTPTSDARYPRIAGGCVVRISDKSAPVEMLTPFGGFKFGDCSVDYRVIVDGEGRTWTDEWEIAGTSQSGCSDINPCIRERGVQVDRLPWKGRIRSDGDGGFQHQMDMCLRTCVGNFVGDYVVKLTPGDTPAGWQVEKDDAGSTGVRFNDSLAIEGDPLEITASDPAG